MNSYKVKRDFDGLLTENCPVTVGIKIGSFDCTANCPHNQNNPHEMEKYGFGIINIKCSEKSKLSKQNQQLTIKI